MSIDPFASILERSLRSITTPRIPRRVISRLLEALCEANAAWEELVKQHEASEPQFKLHRVGDSAGAKPRLLYTSPNADNVKPLEEQTGLD